jgi:hypothetical protein
MSEQHLDALAIAPRLLEGVGIHKRASDVAGVLVDVAQDAARRHVGAALGFEGALQSPTNAL